MKKLLQKTLICPEAVQVVHGKLFGPTGMNRPIYLSLKWKSQVAPSVDILNKLLLLLLPNAPHIYVIPDVEDKRNLFLYIYINYLHVLDLHCNIISPVIVFCLPPPPPLTIFDTLYYV